MKLLAILFFFNLFNNCYSQENGLYDVFDKPFYSCDSLLDYIKIEKSSPNLFNQLKNGLLKTHVINYKELKKYKNKLSFLDLETLEKIFDLIEIQYDWKFNQKNKKIEKIFLKILERDQSYRVPMTDCYYSTRNNDSCRKLNNYEKKMLFNDSLNLVEIDSLWKQFGFPKKEWLGKGIQGFEIVCQHYQRNIVYNNFSVFLEAVKLGYFSKDNYAKFEDGYLLDNCKEQINNKIFCPRKGEKYSQPCTPCEYNKKCCEKKE